MLVQMLLWLVQVRTALQMSVWAPYVDEVIYRSLRNNIDPTSIISNLEHYEYNCERVGPGRVTEPCGHIGLHLQNAREETMQMTWTIVSPLHVWIEMSVLELESPFSLPYCPDGSIVLQAPLIQAEKTLCGNQPKTTVHTRGILVIRAKFNPSFQQILMRAMYQFERKPRYADTLNQPRVLNREFGQSFCEDFEDTACYVPVDSLPVVRYSAFSEVRSIHILANLALDNVIDLTVKETTCDYVVYDGPGTLSPILHTSKTQAKQWTGRGIIQTYVEFHCLRESIGNTTVYYAEHPIVLPFLDVRFRDARRESYVCENELVKVGNFGPSGGRQIQIQSHQDRNIWCVIRVLHAYTVDIEMDFHGPQHSYTNENSSACQFGGVVIKPFTTNVLLDDVDAKGVAICEPYSTRDGVYFNTIFSNGLFAITAQFYAGYTSGSVLLTVKEMSSHASDDTYTVDRFTPELKCPDEENLCSFKHTIINNQAINVVGNEVKDSGVYRLKMKYPGNPVYPYYGKFTDGIRFVLTFQLGERNAMHMIGPIRVQSFQECLGTTVCISTLEYLHGLDSSVEKHEEIYNSSYNSLDFFLPHARYIRYEMVIAGSQWFVFNVSYTRDQTCGFLESADKMKTIAQNCEKIYVPMNFSSVQFQTQMLQQLNIKLKPDCPLHKCLTLNITVQHAMFAIRYEWRGANLTDSAIVVNMFGFVNISWNIDTLCSGAVLGKCAMAIDIRYPFNNVMIDYHSIMQKSHISEETMKYSTSGNYDELAYRKVVNISWKEASEMCERAGGHLPFLKDSSETGLLNQRVYSFLLEQYEPLSDVSMGDITFLGLRRKNGSYKWLDDTPLINYRFWNVPDIFNHFPQSYVTPLRQHWFGISKTSESHEVNRHMSRMQPQSEHECTGMFVNPNGRHWMTIPCDVQIPTRPICHFPEASTRPSLKPHCLSNAIIVGCSCLKTMRDGESCDKIHVKENPEDSLSVFVHGVLDELNISSPQNLQLVDHQLQMLSAGNVTKLCSVNVPEENCPDNSFQCYDLSCIPSGKRCNNIKDCLLGEDEQGCNVTCRYLQSPEPETDCFTNCTWPLCVCTGDFFQCERGGGCVNVAALCDGYSNCQDGSDESYCGTTLCAKSEVLCADGRWCIPAHRWFDGFDDCMDASDEWRPAEGEPCPGFLCVSGQCIPQSRQNDGFPDCEDSSDEQGYILRAAGGDRNFVCEDPGVVPCDGSSQQCFYESQRCVYDTNRHGTIYFCRRAGHLAHCKEHECRNRFKCPSSYCVSFSKVCNGVMDCQDGDDEADCPIITCPNMFHCKQERLCLHLSEVCDGVIHCKLSGDDEKYCRSVSCSGWECGSYENSAVDLSRAKYYIRLVDMSSQDLLHIISTQHSKYTSIVSLSLSNNRISLLSALVFQNCPYLAYLYLSTNKLVQIVPLAFRGLVRLQVLDLSDNLLTSLAAEDFKSIVSLSSLDISGNQLEKVIPSIFDEVIITEHLYQTDARLCCMLPPNVQCFPKLPQEETDIYDCPEKVSQSVLVYSSCWVIPLVLALNGYSIVTLLHGKRKRAMLNLSFADSGYAMYLLILVLSHFFYTSGSAKFVFEWPASLPCILASLVLSQSTIVSLLTIGVISLQSYVLIMFPFSRFLHKATPIILLCFWLVTSIYTLLPLGIMHYVGADVRATFHFCDIVPLFGADAFWANLARLVVISILYVVYVALCIATRAAIHASRKSMAVNEKVILSRRKLLHKILAALLLNSVYYLPLIVVDIIALLGYQASHMMMAVLLSIVFPIPKVSNPLIYNVIKAFGKRNMKKNAHT